MTEDERVERMAAMVHTIWAEWMRYMFNEGGGVSHQPIPYPTMGSERAKRWVMGEKSRYRWIRQLSTTYSDLPENEKESDREIARRYLEVFDQMMMGMSFPTMLQRIRELEGKVSDIMEIAGRITELESRADIQARSLILKNEQLLIQMMQTGKLRRELEDVRGVFVGFLNSLEGKT